jgi:hypothetical protein
MTRKPIRVWLIEQLDGTFLGMSHHTIRAYLVRAGAEGDLVPGDKRIRRATLVFNPPKTKGGKA